MAVYKRDMVDINLETGNIHRSFLKHSIGYKDQQADHFGIRAYRNGEPVNLTGVSIQGIFMPPQGSPIAITSGNIVSGNEAEVVLPQACYNYDGQFTLAIKLVDPSNSVTGTMRIVDGMVDNTHASGTVAPTEAVPTYQEILATYEAMLAATTAATTAATNVGSIVAAAYSTSATYAVGDYCTKDGNLYRCTTAITTAESWTAAHWTQTKMGPDVSDLKSAFDIYESIINDGLYTIKQSDLESGVWNYTTKSANTKRIRTKYQIPVKTGMKIYYTNPSLDLYFGISPTMTSGSTGFVTSGWLTKGTTNGAYTITIDGYLVINARNDASTTDISVNDYDCTVSITAKNKIDTDNAIESANSRTDDVLTMLTNNGITVLKHAGLAGDDLHEYSTNTRVLIGWKNYGKVLKWTVKPGYSMLVYNSNFSDPLYTINNSTEAPSTRFLYAYGGANWAFVIRKITTTDAISFEEAYSNVIIEDETHEQEEIINGLHKETVEFAPNTLVTEFSQIQGTYIYSYYANRAASAPIKIPKGGMRITVNPAKYIAGELVNFRVMCVNKSENGFTINTDNEDLEYVSKYNRTSTAEPVYIPYIENAYIIILTGVFYDEETGYDDSKLNDSIWVYTGQIHKDGKLLGLHPMRAYLSDPTGVQTEPQLSIRWGNENAIVNTTNYYGGFLWLKYAKSIAVNPKYTIVANIYRIVKNGDQVTTEKVDSYYSFEFGDQKGRVAGVQYIDLTKYDFDGIVHFAVMCSVQHRIRGIEAQAYRVPLGMGIMSHYTDVYNNVFVEYQNGYQETVEQGMPSILFDNINDYMNYTYPLRSSGYYVNPHDSTNTKHLFTQTEDISPAFYDGYNGNTVLLNVTGKSYYTAMANPNSRCYNFRWEGEDVPQAVQNAPIGYGITCTDFTCMLLGLKENYFGTQFAFAPDEMYEHWKFDKITGNWDASTEMDLLKPGDVLTQQFRSSATTIDGHCMICYEKKYVNGQLEAVTLIEAGYPNTRFTTLYNDKYFPLVGSWNTFRRLSGYSTSHPAYRWIHRIKPQYLQRIRDVYDLSKEYTPGKIMCDRGTDSIYSVNRGTLAAYRLPISIVDDETTANSKKVRIFKDDGENPIATVSIIKQDEYKKKGMWVLDIKDYITEEGIYTLKLDDSDTVQERFYVQEPFAFVTDAGDAPEGYERIHIPRRTELQYMEVNYGVKYYEKDPSIPGDTDKYIGGFRLTYAPEQFSADTSSIAQDETWGVIDVPGSFNVPEEFQTALSTKAVYRFVILIYGTDYGTFQLRYDGDNPTAISGYGLNG